MSQYINSSSKSSHPQTPHSIFMYTINIVITQAVRIIGIVLITYQTILIATGHCLYQTIPLCGNPNILVMILHQIIHSASHRFSMLGNCSRFCQITLQHQIFIIDA
ncbi:hypothetical protein EVA_04236 [gut metagenome]|uniref:Uncharacterized protein n=1 Tax=gut metagenome TaxID=749906 RepID=J9GK34_9ZZZZ